MLPGTSELDAGFYRLIHELVGPQLRDEPAERRANRRHRFPVVQRIAPRRGDRFPEEDEFVEVRCYDLTRTGFSFFFPMRPDFSSLVASFQVPGQTISIGAEVARCDSVLVDSSGEVERIDEHHEYVRGRDLERDLATPMILVFARFTARLPRPQRP
jgi:hypothetical protein